MPSRRKLALTENGSDTIRKFENKAPNPNSLLKNYGYRRFIKNRAPTRRDEGEYPLWVFD